MRLRRKAKNLAASKVGNAEPIHQLYLKINANRAADLVGHDISKHTHVSRTLDQHSRKSVNPLLVCQINDEKKKTSKKLNTNQPSWDDELLLLLKSGDYSQVLLLTVWDKHKRTKNYLGELRLNVSDIFNVDNQFRSTSDLKWYKLYSNKQYHSFVTGSLLLSFELVVKRKKKSKKKDILLESEKSNHTKETPAIVVSVSSPTKAVKSDLFDEVNNLDLSDFELTPIKTTSEELETNFKNWVESLVCPEQDSSLVNPGDQGFYSDSNEITALDVSDIESIDTTNDSGNGGESKFTLSNGASISNTTSSSYPTSNWLGAGLDDDASSFSEMSILSSDGGFESDAPLSSSEAPDAAKPNSKPKSKLLRLRRQRKSLFDKKFEVTNRKVLGVVFIEIVSAADLPPMKNFTRTSFDMDPFVVVTFGKKTFRTSWKRHTLNPIFNERMAFEILSHERNFNIQFSVLDKDHFSFHDEVANVSLPMKDITDMATAGSKVPLLSRSYMSLHDESAGFSTCDNESLNSNIRILEDDNIVHSVRKKKFTNRKRITALYADTSKFRTMNLSLDINNDKYKNKYFPQLKIRVRFETYEELRRKFWSILLEQYNLNETGTGYDFFELISLLDTLGCNNSDELVQKFYDSYKKLSWGGDLLSHEEIIDSLEQHINSSNDFGENKIFEIERCPTCLQKNLSKKQDIDIITHVAICASKDWSIVNKLLVSSYVSPQIATRRWFSKFLIKLTYGKYKLGSNSANILVQDRTTGIIMEEKMGVYVRLGIRLLYKGLDKAKTRRIRTLLKKLSVKQGIKFDNPLLKSDIPSFIKFHVLDLSQCLEEDPTKYDTFNDFFYRKLKPNARPVEAPTVPKIAVSPADCRCAAFGTVSSATELWIKGRNFTIAKLFNGNFNNYETTDFYKAESCSLGIFRLAPQDYHRFHSPVDGVVKNIKHIDGEYYTVNPMAIRSELDVFGENVRAIIPIETKEFGTVIMVAVGAMMVGSIVLTKGEGDEVKRGEEIGYFKFGGSTIILLFQKKYFQFDSDLVENSKTCVETLIRMGQSIGHSPEVEEYKRDHIDFDKQTKDFKLNLIRVLTGGDLSNSKGLSNWESSHIQRHSNDFGEILKDDEMPDENSYDEDSFDEEGLEVLEEE
jgi:phosphatidylserine decarboxylase